jgi:hypothetical protein
MTFDPTTGYIGAATVTIVTSDLGNTGSGGTLTDTDVVNVTMTNTAPVAVADSFSTRENVALAVGAPGVLANDTDANSHPLTAVLVSGPANAATFSLSTNGSFSFTSSADFAGSTSFTYTANDGYNDSNIVTVTITVAPVSYVSSSNWPTSFDGSRYLALTFPAYVPAGSVVTGAVFRHTYRSDTSGDTTCYWFEVYNGVTLVATRGSSGSPISCNSTFSYQVDSFAISEIDTVAEANAVTVRLYVRNDGGRRSHHRLATIGINYWLD